jgi:hypothetical protein
MAFNSLTLSKMKSMTFAYSDLLVAASQAEVESALVNHAIPRVHLFITTASDNTGSNVMYDTIKDLADSGLDQTIQDLVLKIMEDSTVSEALQRVCAAFAAAWLLLSKYAVLESQQKAAQVLEKQAVVDLEKLCKSPLLKSAAAAAVISARALSKKTSAILYLAYDADATTVDTAVATVKPFSKLQLPYPGAPFAGQVQMIINGVQIGPIDLAETDSPIVIAQKLQDYFEAMDPSLRPNVNLLISELNNWEAVRLCTYINTKGSNTTETGSFKLKTTGARIEISPRNYDQVVDYAAATLSFSHPESFVNSQTMLPGVKGLIYGISNVLTDLTEAGPHSIAVDLNQGKLASSSKSSEADSSRVSDSFYFVIDNQTKTTDQNGELIYQINQLPERSVFVPVNTDATGVCLLLAQDLASQVASQRVLGAVRPSTKITLSGTPLLAPSIEMVAFGLESAVTKFVITIKQVPVPLTFGVVSKNNATQSLFDHREKSVVISPTINKPNLDGSGGSTLTVPNPEYGSALLSPYKPSESLSSILKDMGKFRR